MQKTDSKKFLLAVIISVMVSSSMLAMIDVTTMQGTNVQPPSQVIELEALEQSSPIIEPYEWEFIVHSPYPNEIYYGDIYSYVDVFPATSIEDFDGQIRISESEGEDPIITDWVEMSKNYFVGIFYLEHNIEASELYEYFGITNSLIVEMHITCNIDNSEAFIEIPIELALFWEFEIEIENPILLGEDELEITGEIEAEWESEDIASNFDAWVKIYSEGNEETPEIDWTLMTKYADIGELELSYSLTREEVVEALGMYGTFYVEAKAVYYLENDWKLQPDDVDPEEYPFIIENWYYKPCC